MSKLIIAIPLLLGVLLMANNCAPDTHSEEEEAHHFMDKVRAHEHNVVYSINDDDVMDTTYLIKAHATVPGVADFFTEKREHKLNAFPCSNCHNQALEKMQANRPEGIRKAHWDIELVHAGKNIMECKTCHANDNMNQLASFTGKMISFDESYKLCGQCHSTQQKDWQGGAHGKQLNGWAPPRVATTCTSCHNPHKPGFSSRFPARLNTNQLGEEESHSHY